MNIKFVWCDMVLRLCRKMLVGNTSEVIKGEMSSIYLKKLHTHAEDEKAKANGQTLITGEG